MREIITTSTTNHVRLDPLQTSTQTCRYVWENLFPILSFLMLPTENITAVMTVTIPYIWGNPDLKLLHAFNKLTDNTTAISTFRRLFTTEDRPEDRQGAV